MIIGSGGKSNRCLSFTRCSVMTSDENVGHICPKVAQNITTPTRARAITIIGASFAIATVCLIRSNLLGHMCLGDVVRLYENDEYVAISCNPAR